MPRARGICRWCGHTKGWHDGNTPQDIKDRFRSPGAPAVRWERSSCSKLDCRGCRRYET